MKKHTIELYRSKNCPVGYGLMHPFDFYNYKEKRNKFLLKNNYIFSHEEVREEEEEYTDGRFIRSTGWIGGKDKLSTDGWKFCDHIVYLDIYYHDNESLLEENIQLKKDLADLNKNIM